MSSRSSTVDLGHPVTVAAARIDSVLDTVAEAPVWSMGEDETRTTLITLTRLQARLAELELRVAAHADTLAVGDRTGATSTAAWWAHHTRTTRAEAHRKLTLAKALNDRDDRHEPVRARLATGDLRPDQAAVITTAVDALPHDLPPVTRADAEAFLLTEAKAHDAKNLRTLGRRLLEVIDPETADAHEATLLAKEETEARATASLRLVEDGHGRTHGRFTIPTLHAAMLKKALHALAAPRHRTATDGHAPVPGRPSAHRLGEAFCELLETYPTDRLPAAGGTNATVVVTMTLQTLTGGLQAASLDTGERLSPGEARRLACGAGLVPAVLDSDSHVLDLGRTRRYYTPAQRLTFALEQHGCATQGCDAPPALTHAHHPTPWAHGGATNRDGLLLCPRHHTLAHHPDYQMTTSPTHTVTFHRRE